MGRLVLGRPGPVTHKEERGKKREKREEERKKEGERKEKEKREEKRRKGRRLETDMGWFFHV